MGEAKLRDDLVPGVLGTPNGAIDFDHLSHYTAGDATVARDVLAIFRDQAGAWVDRLDPALTDKEWHDMAHALKGSARGIGAFEFARIAEAAEHLTGEGSQASRAPLLVHLRSELERVQAEITRVLA